LKVRGRITDNRFVNWNLLHILENDVISLLLLLHTLRDWAVFKETTGLKSEACIIRDRSRIVRLVSRFSAAPANPSLITGASSGDSTRPAGGLVGPEEPTIGHAVTTSNQPAVYLRVLSPRICAPLCRRSRWSFFPSFFLSCTAWSPSSCSTKYHRTTIRPYQLLSLTLHILLSKHIYGYVVDVELRFQYTNLFRNVDIENSRYFIHLLF